MGLCFPPICHDNFHHWGLLITSEIFLYSHGLYSSLSVFSSQLPVCLSQSLMYFLKNAIWAVHIENKVLASECIIKMHSPNMQKHIQWHILNSINELSHICRHWTIFLCDNFFFCLGYSGSNYVSCRIWIWVPVPRVNLVIVASDFLLHFNCHLLFELLELTLCVCVCVSDFDICLIYGKTL